MADHTKKQSNHVVYRGKAGGKLAENARLSKKNSSICSFFSRELNFVGFLSQV